MKQLGILFLLLLLFATAYAENYVAINSMDGRDVLSGVFYANAKGLPVKFMPVPGGNSDLFATKVGQGHSILLIQSDTPVSSFVENSLRNNNNSVEVYTSTDAVATNLALAKRSGAEGFIVVDSAYSDSALSVLPYAKHLQYYVILADKNNAEQVKAAVTGKRVIIYGLVDKEVSAALASYTPETIGRGEDKFEDNVALNDRLMREFGSGQAMMIDGTFIEEAIASSGQPLILTGSLVPQVTYDFIKQKVREGKLSQIMLIGNQLVVPVYDMRQRIQKDFQDEGLNKTFGVIVKFAQVVPSAGAGVLVLDTFYMPAYKPVLNISEVAYNRQSGMLMVSVGNPGGGSAYYALEARVRVNGADFKVFASNETKLIERGEQLGAEYPLDLSSVSEGNVTALVLVRYGTSKKSLESFVSGEGPLTTISYVDTSNVSVQFAKYDAVEKRLLVTMRNNGAQTAYVFSRVGIMLEGQPTNITSAATRSIDAASLVVEEFPLELSPADLAANGNVSVFVNYGGRPGFLTRHAQYIMALESPDNNQLMFLILPLAVVVALILAAYFLFMRKPQETAGKESQRKERKK
jgi:hypothetical protein